MDWSVGSIWIGCWFRFMFAQFIVRPLFTPLSLKGQHNGCFNAPENFGTPSLPLFLFLCLSRFMLYSSLGLCVYFLNESALHMLCARNDFELHTSKAWIEYISHHTINTVFGSVICGNGENTAANHILCHNNRSEQARWRARDRERKKKLVGTNDIKLFLWCLRFEQFTPFTCLFPASVQTIRSYPSCMLNCNGLVLSCS